MNIVKFPVTDQVKISYLKFEENSRPRYLNKLNQMTRFLNQNVLLTCSWLEWVYVTIRCVDCLCFSCAICNWGDKLGSSRLDKSAPVSHLFFSVERIWKY